MTWEQNQLMHFGILGQKWGVRRYQNPDGTLTEEGKSRYYDRFTDRQKKEYDRMPEKKRKTLEKKLDEGKSYTRAMTELSEESKQRTKRLIKTVAGVGIAAAVGWLGYRASTYLRDKARFEIYEQARDAINNNSWMRGPRGAYRDAVMKQHDFVEANMTRRKAVGNWLKNMGKLRLPRYFDSVVMPDYSTATKEYVNTLKNAGNVTDLIVRR